MAEKEQYYIYIEGTPVEVSSAVYHVFYGMKDQENEQEKKKNRNGVISYDALDSEEVLGSESFPDNITPSLDELLIAAEVQQKLQRALSTLPRKDRELIQAIYYQDVSVLEYAKRIGMSPRGVDKRREKILSKLKSFMNILGSF